MPVSVVIVIAPPVALSIGCHVELSRFSTAIVPPVSATLVFILLSEINPMLLCVYVAPNVNASPASKSASLVKLPSEAVAFIEPLVTLSSLVSFVAFADFPFASVIVPSCNVDVSPLESIVNAVVPT